jgi:hypothetical protein
VIVDPGAVFSGGVAGGGGVVELASAASSGTLSGFGSSITNFSSLEFDPNARWTISGNGSAAGLGTMIIDGFIVGDTIDLTGFAAVGRTFASNRLVLNDSGGGHSTLAIQGAFSTDNFALAADGSGGTDITLQAITPCFAAGTRITTPRGTVPVEHLREGDVLLTVSGKRRPIQWIGRRTVDCKHHISPDRVKPIRIAPHAFGENRPHRALLLSPDHSVFVEDVLIPVKFLVNETTVSQLDVEKVTYYHIELPNHDVVLAEGLPAETYLETGGRSAFENGGGAVQLHPDFASDEARVGMVWRDLGYAPLIGSDGQLGRVLGRLACQALMLGYHAGGGAQPVKRARRAAKR